MREVPTNSEIVDGLKAEANRITKQISVHSAELQRLNRRLEALQQVIAHLEEQGGELPKPVEALFDTDQPTPVSAVPQPSLAPPATKTVGQTGITDAIRQVVREAKRPLTAPEICDRLAPLGYTRKERPNLIQVVHTTVKRLSEIKKIPSEGKTRYSWNLE